MRHGATLRSIPVGIGATFGFRPEVIGRPHAASVEPDGETVILPSPGLIPSSSSKPITQDEFVIQTRIGETSYASYTLEDAFELVPGKWVFEIRQANRKLATQSFGIEGVNFRVERMSNECDSCEGF